MSNRILLTLALVAGLCTVGHAETLPPPLGENLVQDCTFNEPIESTPWQAESGALAEMLCPAGGCGHCPEQVNMLRFKGRDTDDVLAVSQQLDLPAASSYDLSFDLKYCDTRPTGSVSFSLGNFDAYTITIPTRPTSGVRSFAHSFDNSGESPVQPAGLAELVIGNPALNGNDIMVDNVRIVPRFTERECTLDPALSGYWRRKVNGGEASQDSWFFSENGTFYLDAMRGYWDEENGECCISGTTYEGSWCVDNSQTPPAIYLRVDSEGIYESKSAKAEKVFEPDCGAPERAWYGRYQIDGGQLSLRVQECPDPTLDSPPVFLNSGFASDNGAPLISPCETPEGEGTVEAEATEAENTEGEGTVETCPATPTADPAVVGNWGQKCVIYDGPLQFGEGQEWSFNADGTFTLTSTQYGDEWITPTSRGTYTANTSVSPAQMDLHTCETCFDDIFDEYEECDYCCFTGDYNQQAIYAVEGDVLSIATGTTRPEALSIDDQHKRNESEYCPTDVEGEGEGAGTTSLAGTWGRGVCDKDLELPNHEWTFNGDRSFQEVIVAVDAGSVVRYSGTYEVNLETSPAQVHLHYTLRETYDDVVEEGEACGCAGGCCIDSCEALDFTDLGVFEIVGNTLYIATDDCRPDSTVGALEHEHDGTFCVSEEALGEFDPTPGECLEEGEGEGSDCKGDKCEGAEDGEPEPNDVLGAIIGFEGADGNGDGRLNFSEATNLRLDVTTFNTLDLNGDGQLSPAELLYGAGAESPRHTADTDFDGGLSLAELLRSIQMYNAGGYSCAPQADSEDGYLPQPFDGKGADPGCPPHASDYAPADGVISLSELLRAIQLYNSGAYDACGNSGEDGFCL